MASCVKKWKGINKKVNTLLDLSSDDETTVKENANVDFSLSPIKSINSDDESSTKVTDDIFLSDDYLTDEYYPNTSSESEGDITDLYCSDGYSDDDYSDVGEISLLHKKLAQCATRNRWTRSSVNELLSILRENDSSLPKDARTLLKTPRKIPKEQKCGGDYAYYGLCKGIKSVLNDKNCVSNVIKLSINIDGIPLFKSSSRQMWPILACFDNSDIFIIAIFCGDHKPNNINDYLSDFVSEWNQLRQNGIVFNGHHLSIEIKSFICDAPSRAFLKCIIHHGGYNSCERCIIHGTHEGRVVFNEEEDFQLREKSTFEQFGYCDNHQRDRSPLIGIGIDCINFFALDYMHLVCLGVMRRMLNYLKKGPCAKISAAQISEVSQVLISFSGCMPSEFARQPRSLKELDRWKATEFRQFLLYTGPIALRGVVSKELYEHFLTLSIAMNILLQDDDDKRVSYLDYARDLLKYFVYQAKYIYGNTFTVYNVHNLLHLVDDCRNNFCSLNRISCFPFENFLQRIKKSIRNSSNPVAQVSKRLSEYKHFFGELPTKTLETKISANRKDRCFLLHNSSIAFVKVKNSDGTFQCNVLSTKYLDNVFDTPAPSMQFSISLFRTINFNKVVQRTLSVADFQRKCVCLEEKRGLSIFPLLHYDEKLKP